MSVPPLRTARLRLDPLDPARDAADLLSLWSDPRYAEFQVQTPPTTPAAAAERMSWVALMPAGLGGWMLRLADTGEAVGRVSLREWIHDPSGPPELGWYVVPRLWGQGLATEAMRGVLHHAWTAVGASEVIALVMLANQRSHAVARRLGGVVRDQGTWYGEEWPCLRYVIEVPVRTSEGARAGSMGADPTV